ncbi:MAG: phosphatidic acid phosphatase, partial [Bacteroidota bacterium]
MKHFWNVCLAACMAAALGPLTGCAPDPTYETDAYEAEHLRGSMHALTATMVHDIFSPPQAARAYAYPSIAAYEAVRHLDPSAESMAGRLNGLEQISEPDQPILAPLASLRAFLRVGQALVFSEERIASYAEARYAAFRQMGVPSELFDASIAYGDLVAEEVLTWASSDYYLETRSYPKFTVTGEPGVWQPTPPAYMDGVEPHWREIRPFVLDSAAQFSPPPPPPYSVEEGSPFMELVEEVYEVGNELTYEQRAIASF